MAQNINPFMTQSLTPSKTNDEKRNKSQDNHAVTKRYFYIFSLIERHLSVYLLFIVLHTLPSRVYIDNILYKTYDF